MTVRFRTEPEASAELDDAVAWYERHRTGLGGEFLEAIDDTLDFIARWPRAATLASGVPGELGVRRAPVRRFPYMSSMSKARGLFEFSRLHTIAAHPATGFPERWSSTRRQDHV